MVLNKKKACFGRLSSQDKKAKGSSHYEKAIIKHGSISSSEHDKNINFDKFMPMTTYNRRDFLRNIHNGEVLPTTCFFSFQCLYHNQERGEFTGMCRAYFG